MAPSELIEGQLGDPTEYIPETDETLLVYNPCKPTSISAHCCGSRHMSGFHGLGLCTGFHGLGLQTGFRLAFTKHSPASNPPLQPCHNKLIACLLALPT